MWSESDRQAELDKKQAEEESRARRAANGGQPYYGPAQNEYGLYKGYVDQMNDKDKQK